MKAKTCSPVDRRHPARAVAHRVAKRPGRQSFRNHLAGGGVEQDDKLLVVILPHRGKLPPATTSSTCRCRRPHATPRQTPGRPAIDQFFQPTPSRVGPRNCGQSRQMARRAEKMATADVARIGRLARMLLTEDRVWYGVFGVLLLVFGRQLQVIAALLYTKHEKPNTKHFPQPQTTIHEPPSRSILHPAGSTG